MTTKGTEWVSRHLRRATLMKGSIQMGKSTGRVNMCGILESTSMDNGREGRNTDMVSGKGLLVIHI
jgi:hypothetical protein